MRKENKQAEERKREQNGGESRDRARLFNIYFLFLYSWSPVTEYAP